VLAPPESRAHECLDDEGTLQFWHPRITARFSSPLVDPINLAISGDSHWRRITNRVARRLKAIGTVSGTRKELEQAMKVVRRSGGHGDVFFHVAEHDQGAAMITIAGTVGATFDLPALAADYEAYLAAAPALAAEVARELERLSPLSFAELDWLGVRVEMPPETRRAGSLARCGLLLGYPIATTAALSSSPITTFPAATPVTELCLREQHSSILRNSTDRCGAWCRSSPIHHI
jgi:hypothetical protein